MNKNQRHKYRRGYDYAKAMQPIVKAIRDSEFRKTLVGSERVIVEEAMQKVTDREAECLDLYYAQGLNYERISDRLHINVSTISRNISRGAAKIDAVVSFAKALMEQTAEDMIVSAWEDKP